jgi:hypothetical protein
MLCVVCGAYTQAQLARAKGERSEEADARFGQASRSIKELHGQVEAEIEELLNKQVGGAAATVRGSCTYSGSTANTGPDSFHGVWAAALTAPTPPGDCVEWH